MEAGPLDDSITTSVQTMRSSDGARVPGVLYRVPGSPVVAMIMHPRLDMTRHYLTSVLTSSGISVFAVGSRSVGNDLTLVHEETLLDVAAGVLRLRELEFGSVIVAGASGGGPLFSFYLQQCLRPAADRISRTPSGDPIDLTGHMEIPDAAVFVAPHPGQGLLLQGCIDAAVVDEGDPRVTDPELDLFSRVNGFAPPFESSTYSEDFLAEYAKAQRSRVERIDQRALEMIEERTLAERSNRPLASRIITVYRTDADPRTVDLSIDPSDRPYGSVHGSRPHLGNLGVNGFGRLSTPEAWLSTWSGLSSNVRFVSCAPEISMPILFIEYTGDQANFPTPSKEMFDALSSVDKTHERVRGTHFGGAIFADEEPGGVLAGRVASRWIGERFDMPKIESPTATLTSRRK